MHIGYIRVSTKEQSTLRQLDGVHLDQEPYIDKVSGATKDRPNLTICLLVLRKGDTLHVHSIDRLARNLSDLEAIVKDLLARGVTVRFHTECLTFEGGTDNPFAMFTLQILGAIAQFERRILKARQLEGTEQAKIHGTKSGKPWGKKPLDMSLRPKAIEMLDQGHKIKDISSTLKVSRTSIYKLLKGHTKTVQY